MGDQVVIPLERGSGADVGLAALKLAGDVVKANRQPVPAVPRQKDYSNEVTVAGEELRDYTTRTANGEGTHVHVIQHKEWFEKIKQPPTAEELAAQKKEDRIFAGIMGGLLGGALLLFGGLAVADSRARRKSEQKNG